MAEQYKVAGLNIHATYSPSKIVKGPDGKLTLHAESKQGEKLALEGLDHVLMATGRASNTRNLGLEEVSATAICDVDRRQAQTACSEQISVCEPAGEEASPWGAYKVAACTAGVVLSSRPKGTSTLWSTGCSSSVPCWQQPQLWGILPRLCCAASCSAYK